jgi:malonate decarboxylase alpha subunit
MKHWDVRRKGREGRIANGMAHATGKIVAADKLVAFPEAVIFPSDRVCMEGDSQKRSDTFAHAFDSKFKALPNLHLSGHAIPMSMSKVLGGEA